MAQCCTGGGFARNDKTEKHGLVSSKQKKNAFRAEWDRGGGPVRDIKRAEKEKKKDNVEKKGDIKHNERAVVA